MNETIKENIRLLRKERQMTQEQLAEAMGVSGAAVTKWENGQSAPDLSALIALAGETEEHADFLNPEKPIEWIGNLSGSHHELRDMLLSAAGGEKQDAENEG